MEAATSRYRRLTDRGPRGPGREGDASWTRDNDPARSRAGGSDARRPSAPPRNLRRRSAGRLSTQGGRRPFAEANRRPCSQRSGQSGRLPAARIIWWPSPGSMTVPGDRLRLAPPGTPGASGRREAVSGGWGVGRPPPSPRAPDVSAAGAARGTAPRGLAAADRALADPSGPGGLYGTGPLDRRGGGDRHDRSGCGRWSGAGPRRRPGGSPPRRAPPHRRADPAPPPSMKRGDLD